MNILKFVWQGIGKPGSYVVLMGVIAVTDTVAPSAFGHAWFGLCLLAFYLSCIAETLHKILEKLPTKKE